MFSIKINIIYFILFITIVQVEALDPLPVVEDNNIAITEAVIRNTVNSLFAPFNIKSIKRKPQIQQYSKIHNYFVSITLKDCENLKKIARLSTVTTIDNDTQNYITQINEVLNEGDKGDHVTTYIETFINKLRYLKEKYVSENHTDINNKILKILEDNQESYKNVTVNKTVSNGTDDHSQDKNILDDNDEYWQSSGRRIFEGIRTKIKHFPFMASIHFFSTFQCAGCIITNDLVITSASCLQVAWNNRFFRENPSFLAVRVGSNMYQVGGDYIPVVEIYFHPQYSPETLSHNLAIMRLGRVLRFRKSVKSIKKINYDKNPFPLTSTTQITVVGWGARDSRNMINDVYENRLSYAELSFYPLPECQEHYSKVYVTNRNFCAGFFSKGGGACNNDAGGPGISDSKLMGVISFGSPDCGTSDAPTVFTKLGYYVDWIESVIEQDMLIVKTDTTTWSPIPTRLPFVSTTKPSTRLLIQPVNFPAVRLEDVLRARVSNETSSDDDFVSIMFSGENDKNILEIDDSKEKNYIRADQEKVLTTKEATAEWFIKTTTPITVAPEPMEHLEDRREVFKLNMSDDELTIKPSTTLPLEDQNPSNHNPEEPTAYTMSNEDLNEAATTTFQTNQNSPNYNQEEPTAYTMSNEDLTEAATTFQNNQNSPNHNQGEPTAYTMSNEVSTEAATITFENNQNPSIYNQEEPTSYTMSNEVSTDAPTITFQNSTTTNSSQNENSLLHDIMVLIDNLDIDSLFHKEETEQNDYSQKNEIPTNEGELNSIALEEKVENNPIGSVMGYTVESTDDGDYDDDYDDDYENEDRGLAIQAETFQDLTFREIANKTEPGVEQYSESEIGIF